MFDLKEFIFKTVMDMVGREPDYKVRQYALGWMDKGQLEMEEMHKVDAALQSCHKKV